MKNEVNTFLRAAVKQRMLLENYGLSKKKINYQHLKQIEDVYTNWNDPVKFLRENYDMVHGICPENMYKQLDKLMEAVR